MHVTFLLPTAAEAAGGIGLAYAEGLAAGLATLGHTATIQHAPTPSHHDVLVIDGMLLSTFATTAANPAKTVALIHHLSPRAPTDEHGRAQAQATERAVLPRMHRVICTSAAMAARVTTDYAIPAARCTTIPPGADHLPRTIPAEPCHILAAGVLTRRKGHDILLHALAKLTDIEWHLTIAGHSARDPAHAAALAALIPELGLADRVSLIPDPHSQTLHYLWQQTGLFALASRWEAYPSATAQALRRGIPVVVTAGGDIVPPGAGAVCEPGDIVTLSKVLRRVLFSPTLRGTMAVAAWEAGQALPDWATQAALFLTALQE